MRRILLVLLLFVTFNLSAQHGIVSSFNCIKAKIPSALMTTTNSFEIELDQNVWTRITNDSNNVFSYFREIYGVSCSMDYLDIDMMGIFILVGNISIEGNSQPTDWIFGIKVDDSLLLPQPPRSTNATGQSGNVTILAMFPCPKGAKVSIWIINISNDVNPIIKSATLLGLRVGDFGSGNNCAFAMFFFFGFIRKIKKNHMKKLLTVLLLFISFSVVGQYGTTSNFKGVKVDGALEVTGVHSKYGEMEYHASAGTLTIDETSQNYGIDGEYSAGDCNGFSFTAGSNGAGNITTAGGGDTININDEAHGLVTGDFVAVQSANHDGIAEVTKQDNDNFRVGISFVGNEASTWQEGDYLSVDAGSAGTYHLSLSQASSAGNPAKEFHIHAVLNDTSIDGISLQIVPAGANHDSDGATCLIIVAAGDRIWVVNENESDAEDLDFEDSNLNLHKL